MTRGAGEPVGVGIIGCGYWGINYVRVFDEMAEARIGVLCDFQEKRLSELGQRFEALPRTTRVEDVLARDDISVVVISTPAMSHYEVTRRCLEAGKHVLVEKPLATTVHDAEALVALAAARGLTLMVGHTFLYNPGVSKVKEYIDEGTTGRIYYLYSRRTNMGPIRRDVSALWDLAPHDISIFNYLLGRQPEWVSAVGANVLQNARADVGFITLGYGDHMLANIHVSWSDPDKVRELVVVGSRSRILFDDLSAKEPVKVFEKGVSARIHSTNLGPTRFNLRDGDIISPHVPRSEPLKNQCRHLLNCVITGEHVRTDGASGVDVVRVMAAIDRSVAANGVPMPLDSTFDLSMLPQVPVAVNGTHNGGNGHGD